MKVYDLSSDLTVQNPNGTRTVFPQEDFKIGFTRVIQPFNDQVKLDIHILRPTVDGQGRNKYEVVATTPAIQVDEQGRPGGMENRPEYQAYKDELNGHKDNAKTLRQEIGDLREQIRSEVDDEIKADLKALRDQKIASLNTLNETIETLELNPVVPQYAVKDTYEDVNQKFDRVTQGLNNDNWFGNLEFMGGKLSDFIVIPE